MIKSTGRCISHVVSLFAIGLAAVCIGVPVFLVYWTDKRKKRAFEKRNKKSDDMKDLDHY